MTENITRNDIAESIFDEIGLSSHLGPSRSNGLNSLKKKIASIATELSKN